MKKETRFNLIFLALFLAISLPGAAILFRAKLDPKARIMYMPPSVRKTLAYMVPQETADDVVRTQPTQIMDFVERLVPGAPERKPMRRHSAGGRREPVISQKRYYELLDMRPSGTGHTVWVLLWRPGELPQLRESGPVEASAGWDATITNTVSHPLPESLREVMREEGYTSPPSHARVLRVQVTRTHIDADESPQPPEVLLFDPRSESEFLPLDRLPLPLIAPVPAETPPGTS